MHNRQVIKRTGAKWVVLLVAGVVTCSPTLGQRRSNQVRMETGLFNVFPGQTIVVSLTSTKRQEPPTRAEVLLLDSRENVVAEERGPFSFGEPLFLEIDRDAITSSVARSPFRVTLLLEHPGGLDNLSAIATVETENRSVGQSFTTIICPVPSGPDGGKNGPVLFSCGPCKCEIGGLVTPR